MEWFLEGDLCKVCRLINLKTVNHTVAEARRAARSFHSPQQNIFLADIEGAIGYVAAGRVPKRPRGGGRAPIEGKFHRPYSFTSFETLPRSFKPASGLIVNANDKPPGGDILAWRWPILTRVLHPKEGFPAAIW